MQLDPKTAIILNVIYFTLTGLTASVLQQAGVAYAGQVAAWAMIIAGPLNVILHSYSSPVAGPLAASAASVANKIGPLVLAILAGSLLFGAPRAEAATVPVGLTLPAFPNLSKLAIFGGKTVTLDQVVASIGQHTLLDIRAGKAVFDALSDTPASGCYGEIDSELSAILNAVAPQVAVAATATMPAVPARAALSSPHLFLDIAIARTIALANATNSKLNNACAAVAVQTGQSVGALVTGAIAGVLKVGPVFGMP